MSNIQELSRDLKVIVKTLKGLTHKVKLVIDDNYKWTVEENRKARKGYITIEFRTEFIKQIKLDTDMNLGIFEFKKTEEDERILDYLYTTALWTTSSPR